MDSVLFVKEVERHPCLYNTMHYMYGYKLATTRAWDEIGQKLNMTGFACKDKWRNLRIAFMRHMKLLSLGKTFKPYYLQEHMKFLIPFLKSAAPAEIDALSISSNDETDMTDIVEEPIHANDTVIVYKTEPIENYDNTCTSEHIEAAGENSHMREYIARATSTEDLGHKKPKRMKVDDDDMARKLTDYLKRKFDSQGAANDPVRSFLDSLAPELREMNDQQFKTFKRKVFTLIDDIMSDANRSTFNADNNYVANHSFS